MNIDFEINSLCRKLSLGKCQSNPISVSGGFLHKMYAIETTTGRYAIRLLNPQIMKRPNVIRNMINSELIANKAAKYISALPAMIIDDKVLQKWNGQYYLAYPWVDGKSLGADEITPAECAKIGFVLADIHNTDFSDIMSDSPEIEDSEPIEWGKYLELGKEKNAMWLSNLSESIEKPCLWNEQNILANKVLGKGQIISHRDMDSKNVLWQNETPIIIDWESAGYVNPLQELIRY